jgi:hypothetical protein
MDQLEYIAAIAVFITVGLAIGYFIGKHKNKAPKHKILVERITYDYLQERDELLSFLQEHEQYKTKSPVMYAVKDYVWTN